MNESSVVEDTDYDLAMRMRVKSHKFIEATYPYSLTIMIPPIRESHW